MGSIQEERGNWRDKMKQESIDNNLTEEEKNTQLKLVAEERTSQFALLQKAALLKSRGIAFL